jgi:hypothetical protein
MVAAELAMRLENLKRQMGLDTEDKLDRILSYSGKTPLFAHRGVEALRREVHHDQARHREARRGGQVRVLRNGLEAEFARQARELALGRRGQGRVREARLDGLSPRQDKGGQAHGDISCRGFT